MYHERKWIRVTSPQNMSQTINLNIALLLIYHSRTICKPPPGNSHLSGYTHVPSSFVDISNSRIAVTVQAVTEVLMMIHFLRDMTPCLAAVTGVSEEQFLDKTSQTCYNFLHK